MRLTQRSKDVFLFSRCLYRRLFFGRADAPVEKPERILIIQMAKLGDMICTTPMFRAVKQSYPHAKLLVVGTAINKEIVAGNTDIDEYIVYSGDIQEFIKKIKLKRIDFACLTSPHFNLLAALYLSGIPSIAAPRIERGWSPYETFLYRSVRKSVISVPHQMGTYAPREYLRLLEPIGITTDDTKKHLAFSSASHEKVLDFYKKNTIALGNDIVIGISVSAGNKIKNWPAENWATVCQKLVEKYQAKIVLIGGMRDVEEVEATLNQIKSKKNIFNALNAFSVDELKAAISKMSLFVAVDTGPIYVAEAYDIPTVDIVGPMDEHEQPPQGPKHLVVLPPERKDPMLHIMNARIYNAEEARRQIESITPDMVLEACETLLGK